MISLLTNKKVYLTLYFTLLRVFKSTLFLKHSGCSGYSCSALLIFTCPGKENLKIGYATLKHF